MAHERARNLRLDRRLLQRRGWIDPQELERELGALPDVSEKARRGDEAEPPAGPSKAASEEGA